LALEFEWNPRKDAANFAKHGVSFEEAATVFGSKEANEALRALTGMIKRRRPRRPSSR
jgi:uncharacterized DUF497 family protein